LKGPTFAIITATERRIYKDSLAGAFEEAYQQKCLNAINLQTFTVSHPVESASNDEFETLIDPNGTVCTPGYNKLFGYPPQADRFRQGFLKQKPIVEFDSCFNELFECEKTRSYFLI
jgi:hypothetical protein